MVVVYIVASVVSLAGVAIWIGLLLWAARDDGRDQRRRDQEHGPKDGSRAP